MDASKEVLDQLLDVTPYEKFIDILKDNAEDLIGSKFLMSRTMTNFKEQQGMSEILIDSQIADLTTLEKKLDKAQSEPNRTQWDTCDPIAQYVMLFKTCNHAIPLTQVIKEGRHLCCHICLQINKNKAFSKILEEEGKHTIARSDQINLGVSLDDSSEPAD